MGKEAGGVEDRLTARLEVLRREYVDSVPPRIDAALTDLEALASSHADATLIERIWQTAHQIYGTAGSYGLDELSKAARTVETLLASSRSGASVDSATLARCEAYFRKMKAQALETART